MKVFVVQKILNFAGSEIYLQHLLPALRRQNVNAHFGLLCDDAQSPVTVKYKERLEQNGVPVFVFTLNKIPSFRQLKKISRHLAAQQYDLVHTHLLLSDMSFALIKTFFYKNIHIVSTKHGYNEAYNNRYGFQVNYQFFSIYRLVAWLTEKKITRSFAVSKALRQLFIGLKICRPENIEVVYHGFDYDDISPCDAYRFSDKQIAIVGRLTAFKGHRFALQAMPSVLKEMPSAKLVIVGDGPLKEELQQIAKALNIEEQVVFTGFHSQPREVVASSDIVVVPSVAEAFGLVILESMAAKKPIVAFNVPTPSEILEDNYTAMIAAAFDVEALAKNIITLFTDKNLYHSISDHACEVQKKRFNLATMVSNTINFYEETLRH